MNVIRAFNSGINTRDAKRLRPQACTLCPSRDLQLVLQAGWEGRAYWQGVARNTSHRCGGGGGQGGGAEKHSGLSLPLG